MSADAQTTSTNYGNRKCIKCFKYLIKIPGTRKLIETEEEAQVVANRIDKCVDVGDILCNKCRKNFNFNIKRQRLVEVSSQQPISTQEFSESLSLTSLSQSSGSVIEYKLSDDVTDDYVDLPFPRTLISHMYCCICRSKTNLKNVPFEARMQSFTVARIYIPKNNVCCKTHLIKKRFYNECLHQLCIQSSTSSIPVDELSKYLECLSVRCDSTLLNKIGSHSISEKDLKVFTGLSWENINFLTEIMVSMKNSECRTIEQALIIFLLKLRTGNSNQVICSMLGLEREQMVSDFCASVLKSFSVDILPTRFGISSISREDLIKNETSDIANKVYNLNNKLALIFDGTYVRHEKSTNNAYQRKSYSSHKKLPLCKPFTICTTNGYIVDIPGPFYATQNDATIMEILLSDPDGLIKIFKKNDIAFVDRGFRDVKTHMEAMGYEVHMPALKGKRSQLSTEESNSSRLVTKLRWVVEAVHGIIGKKYKLLHHQLDNKLLPSVRLFCQIVCFLNNTFGKRLGSDKGISDIIVERLLHPQYAINTLAQEVEDGRWGRRKSMFSELSSTDVLDFPEISEEELKIFFTGSYQLAQAISYLGEIIEDNCIKLQYLKINEKIIKIHVRSRHINKKTYKCYIEYEPNYNSIEGILRYVCDCANGLRTIGCCSHVASIIYYLSHARYLAKIVRPAEILTNIFTSEDIDPVIEEDSDDD